MVRGNFHAHFQLASARQTLCGVEQFLRLFFFKNVTAGFVGHHRFSFLRTEELISFLFAPGEARLQPALKRRSRVRTSRRRGSHDRPALASFSDESMPRLFRIGGRELRDEADAQGRVLQNATKDEKMRRWCCRRGAKTSGCHCTPRTKLCSALSIPSMTPSSASALTMSPRPTRFTA